MKKIFLMSILAAVAFALSGCAAKAKMASGKSAAEVVVRAEPKKGYKPPPQGSPSYGGGPSAQVATGGSAARGAYTELDYWAMHGIVVWLEPVLGTVPAGNPQTVTTQSPARNVPDESAVRVAAV